MNDDTHDEALDALVHAVDLDALVRLIDQRSRAGDWAGLLRVRDRCQSATRDTGRQLWPAATLAEYRLALAAPAEWAATVLDGEAGRFTIGPLSEVVAVQHSWAELEPHLAAVPVATYVAHERAVRGETIDAMSVARLPAVLDMPVALQRWEPAYPISTYTDDGAEHPEPPITGRPVEVSTTLGAERLIDDDVELALRQLVEAWTTASTGRAEVVCVEGDHLAAVGALGVAHARVTEIPAGEALAWIAWAGASGGAHGRRRGMANGRFSMWWLLAAISDLLDEWPPTADAVEAAIADLRWYRWDAHEPPGGWRLQLAIVDDEAGVAWAINAADDTA